MTDLTNKVDKIIKEDVSSLQTIVDKFSVVLQGTLPERELPYLAYIVDKCVNHINENHKDLSSDWKSWAVLVVRHLYLKGKIKKDGDVVKVIDEFVAFWKSDYEKYCANIISVTPYDKDRGFVYRFIDKKNR
jgi:hypothetical protein